MKNLTKVFNSWPVQVRASFVFLICSFLQKGISFITTPIFTRILSTAEYGQFSVFNSWMQIITPIVSLNLYSGVYSQGVVKFEKDRDRYSSSLQGLSLLLAMLWLAVYLFFQDQLNTLFSVTTVQMIAMFLMIWASGSFTYWSVDQRVDFRYRKLAIITILVSIVQPLVCVLLILNSNHKVTARILGMAIVQFVFYTGAFISQVKKGETLFDKKYWQYALRFNIPLLPHYLSLTVLSSSDRIMIGNMVGADKAGVYNLAYSVSMIMTMFNNALLQTIEPWIYKKLRDKKISEISRVAYPCFILIAGVNLLLILFAPEVIAIFAPAEYYEAIWVVPSVALSVFFMFLYSFFATFEFYYEKTNYVAMATVGGAVLNIVLNYFFIKKFGYLAAGYTTLFSYTLFAILHYAFMKKICRDYIGERSPYNGKLIFLIGFSSCMIGLGCLLLYRRPIVRYLLMLLVAVVVIIFRKRLIQFLKSLVQLKQAKNN